MIKAFVARAGACGLMLALAACAQPVGQTGAGAPPAPGTVPAGPATSAPGGVGRMQMPQMPRLALPWGMGGAGAGGAAAQQVRDPFAGQGVRQPGVEPPRGTAPVATRAATPPGAAAPGAAPAAAPRSHKVEAGETAWSISRKYGVSIQDLAAANALPASMSVRLGQTLTIPGAAGTGGRVAVTAPGVGSPTPQPPSAARPLPDEKTVPAAKPAPKTDAPDLGRTRTAASGSGRFAMPVNGSIIRPYRKGSNEGIDISAPAGSPVKAASSGTVAAITRDTEGVPIVVVRHDGGLMTVYAGMGALSVGKGDSVKSGQTLGTARSTGVVHFEVRKGFDSVDPEDYL